MSMKHPVENSISFSFFHSFFAVSPPRWNKVRVYVTTCTFLASTDCRQLIRTYDWINFLLWIRRTSLPIMYREYKREIRETRKKKSRTREDNGFCAIVYATHYCKRCSHYLFDYRTNHAQLSGKTGCDHIHTLKNYVMFRWSLCLFIFDVIPFLI